MATPKFQVEVKNGRIDWSGGALKIFQQYVNGLNDGIYEMVIQKQKKPKSDQQRAYYWAVIMKTIADETGQDELSVHAFCKYKFLPHNIDSTERLSTAEQEEYNTKIRVFFSQEYGIYIPLPNEATYE